MRVVGPSLSSVRKTSVPLSSFKYSVFFFRWVCFGNRKVTVKRRASSGPMPQSQLFWMGTLMRSTTGFWSPFANSDSEPMMARMAIHQHLPNAKVQRRAAPRSVRCNRLGAAQRVRLVHFFSGG
jgi:hypothetical protein